MTQPVTISGKPTAVGTCIESSWGLLPLTAGVGNAHTIGIAGTNPHRFIKVQPSGGMIATPKIDVPETEIDGVNQPTRSIMTARDIAGDLTYLFDPESGYYDCLGIMGRDVQTILTPAASDSGVAAVQHVMKVGAYAPSFTREEQFLGGGGRLSSGLLVSGLEFTFGEEIVAKPTYVGKHIVPNTYLVGGAATDFTFQSSQGLYPIEMGGDGTKTLCSTAAPTYVDVQGGNDGNGPLIFANLGFGTQGGQFAAAVLTIDGTAYNANFLPGATMKLARSIETAQCATSGYEIGTCTAGVFTVKGELDFIYSDEGLHQALLRHSTMGLNFKYSGVQIGTTANNYALEVFMNRITFTAAPMPLTDKQYMVKCSYTARIDPATGSTLVLTLTNTFDNTLGPLAGAYTGTTPYGLGGWQAE